MQAKGKKKGQKCQKKSRTNEEFRVKERLCEKDTRKKVRTDEGCRQKERLTERNTKRKARASSVPQKQFGKMCELVANFKRVISEKLNHICTCCDQIWYSNSVVNADLARSLKPEITKQCLTGNISANNTEWICRTCYQSIKDGRIPSMAKANGMGFPSIPEELKLNPLEERLCSPRIPFMQIRELPRGGQLSIHGNVVNVPCNVAPIVTSLPRLLSDSATIPIKFKRKLQYKSDYQFQNVRPNKVIHASKWLLDHSQLFQSQGLHFNNQWEDKVQVEDDKWKEVIDEQQEQIRDMPQVQPGNSSHEQSGHSGHEQSGHSSHEEIEAIVEQQEQIRDMPHEQPGNSSHEHPGNSSHEHPGNSSHEQSGHSSHEEIEPEDSDDEWNEVSESHVHNLDTVLQNIDFNQSITFAPGEGNTPISVFQDTDAEYLAFPSIYCGKKPPISRRIPIHYSSLCKWELRARDRRVAQNVPNLFFKLKKLQMKQLKDKVSLAVRKCQTKGKKLTAGELRDPGGMDQLVKLDEGYYVLKTLRGSPPYLEACKKELFAYLRQLGIPTFFCSFSAADTKWLDMLRILGYAVDHKDYTDEELASLTWDEVTRLVKSDPVTCTRHFDFRVQRFLQLVLLNPKAPIGPISDYYYRVEFQQRGSPHIHMLVWIADAPVYGKDTNKDVTSFIDKYVTCHNQTDGPLEDVMTRQIHRHTRTCKKGKNPTCRFNFPIPPMPETTILEPLTTEEFSKDEIRKHKKAYADITTALNDVKEEASFEEFLDQVKMSFSEYELAVRSSIKTCKVFLKRSPSENRVNSYNPTLLEAWEANLDIQYVLDAYACAAYIVSYVSKGQRGMSNLLHQACKEARKGNADITKQVQHIGNQFLSKVEICAAEACYLILQLPIKKGSRQVTFINTAPPDDRTFLVKSLDDLQSMSAKSTDIAADNDIKRYARRPRALDNWCLADYVATFDVQRSAKKPRKQAAIPPTSGL